MLSVREAAPQRRSGPEVERWSSWAHSHLSQVALHALFQANIAGSTADYWLLFSSGSMVEVEGLSRGNTRAP